MEHLSLAEGNPSYMGCLYLKISNENVIGHHGVHALKVWVENNKKHQNVPWSFR